MKKIFLNEIERNSDKKTYVLKDNKGKYYIMNNNINKIIKYVQNSLNLKLSENIFLSEHFIKELFKRNGFIYI